MPSVQKLDAWLDAVLDASTLEAGIADTPRHWPRPRVRLGGRPIRQCSNSDQDARYQGTLQPWPALSSAQTILQRSADPGLVRGGIGCGRLDILQHHGVVNGPLQPHFFSRLMAMLGAHGQAAG